MKQIVFSCRGAALLLIYIFYMWLADLVRFIALYAGLELSFRGFVSAGILLIMLLVLLIRTGAFGYFGQDRNSGTASGASALIPEFFFMALITVIYLMKAAFPDASIDGMYYHILLQEPKLRDMVGADVFSGHFQGFGFPLPDRCFYFFRILFGYRLGTIWNLICVLVLYVQIIRLLELFLRSSLRRLIPFAAFIIVGVYDIFLQLSVYMVELSSLVLMTESLFILAYDPKELRPGGSSAPFETDSCGASIPIPVSPSGFGLFSGPESTSHKRFLRPMFFAFLQGLFFACKMTNIIYVVPLILLYIFLYQKELSPGIFAASLVCGLLPVSIYLIHDLIMTGNPVFPYFNTIFDSLYFPDIDFRDDRWGGESLTEKLLWPFLLIFDPGTRKTELPPSFTLPFLSGWIALAVCALSFIRGKLKTEGSETCSAKASLQGSGFLGVLGFFIVLSSLLWSFTTGHSRYYMGTELVLLLAGVISADLLLRGKILKKLIAVLIFMSMIPGPFINGFQAVTGPDWNGIYTLSGRIIREQEALSSAGMPDISSADALISLYKKQWALFGKDRSLKLPEGISPELFLVFDGYSAPAVLCDPDVPIISWNYLTQYPDGEIFEAFAEGMSAMLNDNSAAAIIMCEKGSLPDLSSIYEQRFAISSLQFLIQDIFTDKDFYLALLSDPPEGIRDYRRSSPAALVSTELTGIGSFSEDTENVTVSIYTGGLGEVCEELWAVHEPELMLEVYAETDAADTGNFGKTENTGSTAGISEAEGTGSTAEMDAAGSDPETAGFRLLASVPVDISESGSLSLDISLKDMNIHPESEDSEDENIEDGNAEISDAEKEDPADGISGAGTLYARLVPEAALAGNTDPSAVEAPLSFAWVKTDLTGLQRIGGSLYYLDDDGTAQSGWFEEGKKSYHGDYFGSLHTGWEHGEDEKGNDVWYYFDPDGSMHIGWLPEGGSVYYLDENGIMTTGPRNIGGREYVFDESGRLIRN